MSERCDLLRLEAGHKLPASTLWVLQRQYIAAYLNQQRAPGLAASLTSWTSWRMVKLMKVSRCSISHSTLHYMHAKSLDYWLPLQEHARSHVQCPSASDRRHIICMQLHAFVLPCAPCFCSLDNCASTVDSLIAAVRHLHATSQATCIR